MNLTELKKTLQGELFFDHKWITIYSTDASAYKETPLAVAFPKTKSDIKKLIGFAHKNNTFLIPRTAGTSLAGQVVGNGIVVDVSKYMTKIIEFNKKEKWIKIEPGVVLDELNKFTSPHGLFFGPETSTSNRCMIGGMVGNNACGAHSLVYGSTRDHLLELEVILSDESEAVFGEMEKQTFTQKSQSNGLEGNIYKQTHGLLGNKETLKEIKNQYPDPRIKRRNTGYALDLLVDNEVFYEENKNKFNFCNLLAGSEGTLAFITAIKVNLLPVPPPVKGLLCVHFCSLEEALKANLIALKHKPDAIELIDDIIIKCTESNIDQRKNRFFIKDNPAAITIIEFAKNSKAEVEETSKKLEMDLVKHRLGYHFPLLFDDDINKVWSLRKAGLGLLSNIHGDAKPVSVIEDTAVHPEVLPLYISDFKKMLSQFGLSCVYHAHIATGELHLRPVLNLKEETDLKLFYQVAEETAKLVKKHKGSLSGEHGDGRLRGQFIPIILGEKNYELIRAIKKVWDPYEVFNKGKIVDTPKMDQNLRFVAGTKTRNFQTIFDYSDTQGLMRLVEKCNGSGDCRKSAIIGGVMCPSYMATRDEDKTTRSRANLMREILSDPKNANPFNNKELYDILDLCLSCKGCKNECPSGVDMAKLKAEFLFQYHKTNSIPLRSRIIAHIHQVNKVMANVPRFYNAFVNMPVFSNIIKFLLGFAQKRSIPKLHKTTFNKWLENNIGKLNNSLNTDAAVVVIFVDEFTNYNDVETGIVTIQLLYKLGYRVEYYINKESGRTFISKGYLVKAKKCAEENVMLYKDIIMENKPLIGIEPSAILTFRDEYPDLLSGSSKKHAQELSKHVYMIDEFIANEYEKGNIDSELFSEKKEVILLHGHCQQKAIASTLPMKKMLSIPKNHQVMEIKSGCCGMAGSFGYEKEHYELSMKIGELVLFPEIRNANDDVIVCAPGTSCRHHIVDGTGKKALHPVELLYNVLK